ncbi:redoxin domain-containing protein [Hymenobacter cheonanensis]|uniref:redoxin domain-containing protein n=1 Tax=Hymenobacter sp. CA2-7 TaxID=3063993 RepID=UPI0027122AC6|nr:redoxin domain-containing protein [Hymenobacter sp. CA2-7]MDO7887172.1 redoxin domain-containing protein [Hymenobacter sp. CA2-7]
MSFRKLPILLAAALLLATVTVGIARAQGTVGDFTVQKTGGGSTSLSAYNGQKAVVVVFMNPACAYTRLYQERLAALSSAYGGRGVQFMFVNVPINLDTADGGGGGSLATFTDEGAASAALGVSKTTEAVVLQPSGSGFAVRYRGAIDDNPQVASGVQQHYLQQVLDNVLAGRPAGVADKRAAGCLIKR